MDISFFLHGSVHSLDLLQQKGKEGNGKHAWGEAQRTRGASFQESLSRGVTENAHSPPATDRLCSALSTSSLERDSVSKIGTGDCSLSA